MQSAAERNRKHRARKRLIDPDYTKKLYYNNRDKIIAQRKAIRLTNEGHSKDLLYRITFKQKDTDIDYAWIYNKVLVGKCELTGIEFNYIRSGNKAPYTPSIDRIDNTKGYFKDNCHIILAWLNIGRGNMHLQDFIKCLKDIKTVDII